MTSMGIQIYVHFRLLITIVDKLAFWKRQTISLLQ